MSFIEQFTNYDECINCGIKMNCGTYDLLLDFMSDAVVEERDN